MADLRERKRCPLGDDFSLISGDFLVKSFGDWDQCVTQKIRLRLKDILVECFI